MCGINKGERIVRRSGRKDWRRRHSRRIRSRIRILIRDISKSRCGRLSNRLLSRPRRIRFISSLRIHLRGIRGPMNSPTITSIHNPHIHESSFSRELPLMSQKNIKSKSESAARLEKQTNLPKALSQCGHRNGFSFVSTISTPLSFPRDKYDSVYVSTNALICGI